MSKLAGDKNYLEWRNFYESVSYPNGWEKYLNKTRTDLSYAEIYEGMGKNRRACFIGQNERISEEFSELVAKLKSEGIVLDAFACKKGRDDVSPSHVRAAVALSSKSMINPGKALLEAQLRIDALVEENKLLRKTVEKNNLTLELETDGRVPH